MDTFTPKLVVCTHEVVFSSDTSNDCLFLSGNSKHCAVCMECKVAGRPRDREQRERRNNL